MGRGLHYLFLQKKLPKQLGRDEGGHKKFLGSKRGGLLFELGVFQRKQHWVIYSSEFRNR